MKSKYMPEGKRVTAEFYLIDYYGNMRKVELDEFKKEVLPPESQKYLSSKVLNDMIHELIEKKTKIYEVGEFDAGKGNSENVVMYNMISTYYQTFFVQKNAYKIERYKIVFKESESGEELFTVNYLDECMVM